MASTQATIIEVTVTKCPYRASASLIRLERSRSVAKTEETVGKMITAVSATPAD